MGCCKIGWCFYIEFIILELSNVLFDVICAVNDDYRTPLISLFDDYGTVLGKRLDGLPFFFTDVIKFKMLVSERSKCFLVMKCSRLGTGGGTQVEGFFVYKYIEMKYNRHFICNFNQYFIMKYTIMNFIYPFNILIYTDDIDYTYNLVDHHIYTYLFIYLYIYIYIYIYICAIYSSSWLYTINVVQRAGKRSYYVKLNSGSIHISICLSVCVCVCVCVSA